MNRSRKLLALILAVLMILAFVPTALAANTPQPNAADKLHTLGLLAGTSTNPDGSPNYSLDTVLTREAAITLIVNILGKYDEATSGTWETPFTDLTSWAVPFVGYAYANGFTAGKTNTLFGSKDAITAKQYITFVLNALGYDPSSDFKYDTAWEKSDALGFTNGRYNASSTTFVRGDAIAVTYDALSAVVKSTQKPLHEQLIASKVFSKDLADKVGLGIAPPPVTESKVVQDIKAGLKTVQFGNYRWKVLSVEGDKALLITEDIIDFRAYNDELIPVTWETCSMRKYLNSEFYSTFSASEKNQILTTHLVNQSNSQYGTLGGNDTDDLIFLLSVEEANKYFTDDKSRIAYLTTQSTEKLKSIQLAKYGADSFEGFLDFIEILENRWQWRLRSPGYLSTVASYVDSEGLVAAFGTIIDDEMIGVRPAFTISLKS